MTKEPNHRTIRPTIIANANLTAFSRPFSCFGPFPGEGPPGAALKPGSPSRLPVRTGGKPFFPFLNGAQHPYLPDLLPRNLQRIFIQHNEICQLARRQRTLALLLMVLPRANVPSAAISPSQVGSTSGSTWVGPIVMILRPPKNSAFMVSPLQAAFFQIIGLFPKSPEHLHQNPPQKSDFCPAEHSDQQHNADPAQTYYNF